jgi:hypothetical protein
MPLSQYWYGPPLTVIACVLLIVIAYNIYAWISHKRQARHVAREQLIETKQLPLRIGTLQDLLGRVSRGDDPEADELLLQGSSNVALRYGSTHRPSKKSWAQVLELADDAELRGLYDQVLPQARERASECQILVHLAQLRPEGEQLLAARDTASGPEEQIEALKALIAFVFPDGRFPLTRERIEAEFGISKTELVKELGSVVAAYSDDLLARLRDGDSSLLGTWWLLYHRTRKDRWDHWVTNDDGSQQRFTNDLNGVRVTEVQVPGDWTRLVMTFASTPYNIEWYIGEPSSDNQTPEALTLRGGEAVADNDAGEAAIVLAHWFSQSRGGRMAVPDGLRTTLNDMVCQRRRKAHRVAEAVAANQGG